jgi:hypothetical protein
MGTDREVRLSKAIKIQRSSITDSSAVASCGIAKKTMAKEGMGGGRW